MYRNLVDEALTYLEIGWCVYPAHYVETGICTCGKLDCPCPGKHPIGKWSAYRTRLPSEDEVQIWFSTLKCNIGMVTGTVSGFVVVDVDGQEGKNSLHELESNGLKPTLTSETGSGGLHLFYRTSSPVASRVRAYKGIDIRGEGGYVILPPSKHVSGRFYNWYRIQPPTNFNSRLFETWKSSSNTFATPNGKGWYDNVLHGVEKGVRNVTAAKLAGRYFGMGMSRKEVWLTLQAWNSNNIPPLSEQELHLTVTAIHKKNEEMFIPKQLKNLEDIRDLLKGL